MGKRYKHLYEQIYGFENLWLASRKARRGKRQKEAVLEFEYDLEQNLFEIQRQLQQRDYHFSPYEFFMVREPQERLIAAAPYRDRVVHHALCNIIEPILDRAMIFDSYACRSGKGSHQAIERAQSFLRKSGWVLKLDIKKYFFTVDHNVLLTELKRKLSDPLLINLIDELLSTYHSSREYDFFPCSERRLSTHRLKGLPIGNLSSQLFANYFLTPLDRFIKDELKYKHYLRYMDDALVFGNSKQELSSAFTDIAGFLEKRLLKLHETKCQVMPAKNGIRFLGFHIYANRKEILRPNLQRFKKKFKQKSRLYTLDRLAWEKVLLSLNGWLGFAASTNNYKFINQVLENIKFNHPKKDYSFTFSGTN